MEENFSIHYAHKESGPDDEPDEQVLTDGSFRFDYNRTKPKLESA